MFTIQRVKIRNADLGCGVWVQGPGLEGEGLYL
jgi:hypothetical protein